MLKNTACSVSNCLRNIQSLSPQTQLGLSQRHLESIQWCHCGHWSPPPPSTTSWYESPVINILCCVLLTWCAMHCTNVNRVCMTNMCEHMSGLQKSELTVLLSALSSLNENEHIVLCMYRRLQIQSTVVHWQEENLVCYVLNFCRCHPGSLFIYLTSTRKSLEIKLSFLRGTWPK